MEVRITRRQGRPLTLVQLGYFFLAIFFTFFVETIFFLRPGQLASEYTGSQRLAEASWTLVAGLIMICSRSPNASANRFELRTVPLFSYLALLFVLVYVAVPFIAWNAATRMDSADLQQSLSVREGSARQLQNLQTRIERSNSLAELSSIPGLLQMLPADAVTDLGTAKRTAEHILVQRQAALDQQSTTEFIARSGARRIEVARLIAHCAITVFFCVWIWARTRTVRYDFEPL
jgi:hypothetical protein